MNYQSRKRRRLQDKFRKQSLTCINLNAIHVYSDEITKKLTEEAPENEESEEPKKVIEDGAKIREFLRKGLMDSYRDEYKEYSDTIRGLETKAQGTIAIAGIFIAGAFVFLRESSPQLFIGENFLLAGSIAFFVIGVFYSVSVLQVGEGCLPPAGTSIEKMFLHCLSIEQEAVLIEDLSYFINDQANAWKKVKSENVKIINSKAGFLKAAQDFIKMAIVIIAVLVLLRIFLHL